MRASTGFCSDRQSMISAIVEGRSKRYWQHFFDFLLGPATVSAVPVENVGL